MTWNGTIAQDEIKKILQRAILDGRTPHAYCFWGDEGVGKEALAIELARTLNCENPVLTENSAEYCGTCNACRLSATLSHPNISFVFASPSGKSSKSDDEMSDKQIDEVAEQLKLKRENYYHKISVAGGTQIRVDTIRAVRRNLSKSAAMRGTRVIIVCRADEMQKESANAFLKTLEEPHDDVTIILTTSKKEYLLQTILSRCQVIHIPHLNKEDIQNHLISEYNVSEEDARLAASFAQGSLTRAVAFLDDEMQLLRNESVDMLRTALTPKNYRVKLAKSIDELTKDKDKRKIEDYLSIQMTWLRDIEAFKRTNNPDYIINNDHLEIFANFIKKFTDADINNAIAVIEDAYKRIRRNVPLSLLLLNMYINLREALYNK